MPHHWHAGSSHSSKTYNHEPVEQSTGLSVLNCMPKCVFRVCSHVVLYPGQKLSGNCCLSASVLIIFKMLKIIRN